MVNVDDGNHQQSTLCLPKAEKDKRIRPEVKQAHGQPETSEVKLHHVIGGSLVIPRITESFLGIKNTDNRKILEAVEGRGQVKRIDKAGENDLPDTVGNQE